MIGRANLAVALGLCLVAGWGGGATAQEQYPDVHRLMTPPLLRGVTSSSRDVTSAWGSAAMGDSEIFNILGRWWLPHLGSGTHMSTIDSNEKPHFGGDKFEGQMFYIPAGPLTGTQALQRLSSSPSGRRMDSLHTDENGYSLEGPLGHPYSQQLEGTQAIKRWLRTTGPQDRMTGRSGEVPTGYAQETVLGYGYPRAGVGPAQHCTKNFTVHGGQVDLAFSKVAGGTIWELWWNGKQFVNDWEYGRQIQAAVFLNPGDVYNPTEGGDTAGGGAPACESLGKWAHGSSLLYYDVQSVPGSSEIVVRTRTRPLQWDPKRFVCPDPQSPCDPDHPVLWKGTFEKRVTLNYQNHPRWIRWDLDTTFPSAWADTVGFGLIAGHFVAGLNKLYAFDAGANRLSEDKVPLLPDGPNDICRWGFQDPDLQPEVGGLIAATADGKYAIGVYHRSGNGFTHADAFALCAWQHGEGGQYGVRTYAWDVYHAVASVAAGTYSYTVYLTVGTLQNVREAMIAMKDAGL